MSTQPSILVTCPPMLGMIEEFESAFAEKGLRMTPAKVLQTMTEDELVALLPDYDGWIIGDDPASARVLEAGAAGRLKAIVKWGVGVDNVDFEAAERLGLHSANTKGVFGKEVADLAMNYIGGLARQTFRIDREIRQDFAWPKPAGMSLAGKKAGLVGFGDIGRNTAKRMLAAEMELTVYDPFYSPVDGIEATAKDWPNAIEEQDFLVFTAPLNEQTHHMLNRALLSRLKQGVRIVNVGRGPLIEQAALEEGLEAGTIHSVALDVFEVEPLGRGNPLRGYPNNIFGSHNASNTREAVVRVSLKTIDMIADMLDA